MRRTALSAALLQALLLPLAASASSAHPQNLELIILGNAKESASILSRLETFAASITAQREINEMAPEARAILGDDCALNLSLRLRNHAGSAYIAKKIPWDNPAADGLIGPSYSSLSTIVAPVASSMDSPVLSYWATSPILNEPVYSNFFRTIPDDTGIAVAMVAYLSAHGLKFANVAHTPDAYGRGLSDALIIAAGPADIKVKSYELDVQNPAQLGKTIEASLTNVWIFVHTVQSEIPQLLSVILANVRRDVHFIFSETMSNGVLCTRNDNQTAGTCLSMEDQLRLSGSIVVQAAGFTPSSRKAAGLLASLAGVGVTRAELDQVDPDNVFRMLNASVPSANRLFPGSSNTIVGFSYDAVYAFAKGACLAGAAGRPACCKRVGGCDTDAESKRCMILNHPGLEFEGVSGTVKFNSVGSRDPSTAYVTMSKALVQTEGISDVGKGAIAFEQVDELSSNGTWNVVASSPDRALYAGSTPAAAFLPDLWCGFGRFGRRQQSGANGDGSLPGCQCCEQNEWTGVDGVANKSQCKQNVCAAGEYLSLGRAISTGGGAESSDVPRTFMCTECPAGQWSTGSGPAASFYRPDYYKAAKCGGEPAAAAAAAAAEGASPASSTTDGNEQDPGSSECNKCAAGTYSTEAAATSSTTCQPCPSFSSSEPGSTACYFSWVRTLALLIPMTLVGAILAWIIRLRVKRSLKYAIVKVGKRRCGVCRECDPRWSLEFPRQSRFPKTSVEEGAKLGNGAFGEVNQGTLQVGKAALRIAVKHVLESKATDAECMETIVECRLQCELESPFVVECFGFTTGRNAGDFAILLALMDLGDLPGYVSTVVGDQGGRIPEATRLRWMIEVAAALEYMHASNLIHADVAARNLCLSTSSTGISCKLADFGKARYIDPQQKAYLMPQGERVPIRWFAPECLPTQINFCKTSADDEQEYLPLTQANDVWSFGVCVWEVEKLAANGELDAPFHTTKDSDLHKGFLARQVRLDFDFCGRNDDTIQTFQTLAEVAHKMCTRVRTGMRAKMAEVRRSLQAASLCECKDWHQGTIHLWLGRMGAPRVEDADLWNIDSYKLLMSEILNDEQRPDYMAELRESMDDESVLQLSTRLAAELSGLSELVSFVEGSKWPEGYATGHPEKFKWMAERFRKGAAHSRRRLTSRQRGESSADLSTSRSRRRSLTSTSRRRASSTMSYTGGSARALRITSDGQARALRIYQSSLSPQNERHGETDVELGTQLVPMGSKEHKSDGTGETTADVVNPLHHGKRSGSSVRPT